MYYGDLEMTKTDWGLFLSVKANLLLLGSNFSLKFLRQNVICFEL